MLVNLKEILEIATKENKAIGMFNATGLDSIQAIIKAAEELNEPIILGHAEVHNVYNDVSLVAPVMIAVAKNAKVPVCVHLDHGVTLEMIDRTIELGFTSIMVDASSMPFDKNVEFTKLVVEKCHAKNISVEAELGRLVENDGVHKPSDYYTNPEEARKFVEMTNVDALAIAFGTSHGFYKSTPVLDFEVIKECAKSTGIPLVMHGGSGVNEQDYIKAINAGIRKINYYSYMSKAGYVAAKNLIESNTTNYLHDVEFAAMKAMKLDVEKAIKIFRNK